MKRSNAPSQRIPYAIEVKRPKNAARSRAAKAGKAFKQGPQAGTQLVNLSRQPGFPARMIMKHKYADAFAVDTTGTMVKTFIAANGMTSIIGSGHQPSYFDTMTSIYNHYTVIGAILKITTCNSNVNSAAPAVTVIEQNDDSVFAPTTVASATEQANAISFLQPPGTGGGTVSRTFKFSARGTFGPNVLSDPDLQGTSAANPVEATTWLVATQPVDGASRVVVNYWFEIEYVALWEELKDIAQS